MTTDIQRKELTLDEADAICQAFANKYEVVFKREGECGFGRPCCGFSTGSQWVDYNPIRAIQGFNDLNPTGFEDVMEFRKADLSPPFDLVPSAYHKHDCLAVLMRENPHHIIQLANWVLHMEEVAASQNSELFIDQYEKGYKGMQALLGGLFSTAIGVR